MSARNDIWNFAKHHYPGLIGIAANIALGVASPPPIPGYPPLNLLVNGTDPSTTPLGLAGVCQGTSLSALYQAKGSANDGFQSSSPLGLAVLFGTWSDFSLWCWARHPLKESASVSPTIILAKDHDSYAGLNPKVAPGTDWGVADLGQFYLSADPSTVNLFEGIFRASGNGATPCLFGPNANPTHQAALEQFIASKRIFIYNLWPWLRSGIPTTGNVNIHNPLHAVPAVVCSFHGIIGALAPSKIACLGGWSWDTALRSSNALMHRSFLPPHSTIAVDVFRHASAYAANGWTKPWKNPAAWGNGYRWSGKHNDAAFVDFIK